MLTEILNSSSVKQLKGILQSRYGKGLKVKFMMDTKSIEPTAQSPSRGGGDLRILVSADGNFLAEASVENGATLPVEDQETISALVNLVLEPAIQNWKRRNENLRVSHADFGNVISLHPIETEPLDYRLLSTNVMFLQSRSPHLFPKVTTEIHEISERWASLNYASIKAEVQSVQDLCELGALTIVVSEFLTLSPAEQELFTSFLAVANVATDPLVVFTSSTSIQELEALALISPRMASLLRPGLVEVDRLPTSTQLLRESLELLLEPQAMI